MLNSARECPDIDLYVYFVCALAFPFRDPSTLPSLTSRLSLSPDPTFPPRHPLQRRAFQPIAYRESAYTPSATSSPPPRRHPGAGPSRHPGTDAIDAPTRPTTTAATDSRSSPSLNVHRLEIVVFFVSLVKGESKIWVMQGNSSI